MTRRFPDRQRLLEIANGFRAACLLAAAAELDVWSAVGSGALSAAEVAERIGGDLRATTMLLDALVAIRVLEKEDNLYRVPVELRCLLIEPARQEPLLASESSAESILPMLRHIANGQRSWSQLAWAVRAGFPAPRPASIRGWEADRASFIAAMHAICAPIADGLVAELGPPQFRHLLDVGGASGTWTLAFLRAVPSATATIFDLPHAIEMARSRVASSGMAKRITLVSGDFYCDLLPAGADFAWVSAIAHQHSRAHNRELFSKVFSALVPGGRIAVRDIVMQPCRTLPADGALFAINMLLNTETGGTFTFEEFAEDLHAAGFVDPQWVIRREDMNSVIVAQKPEA